MIHAAIPAADGNGWGGQLPLIPHPAELIVALVAFAILYWLYATKVVPRMEELYAERAAAIEGGMKQAELAQAQAQAALDQYNAQLHEARAEANKIREDARAQGASIVAEMRGQAQSESARITEAGKKQIDAERQSAVVSLRSQVGAMSTELASRIVGESLHDQARQSGIVDRFLAELEAGDIVPEKVGAAASAASAAAGTDEPTGDTTFDQGS
ncbi:MAG: F0F1 ATP synthase subunit B [Nostocoides sp.]